MFIIILWLLLHAKNVTIGKKEKKRKKKQVHRGRE